MKRFLCVCIVCGLLVIFSACDKKSNNESATDKTAAGTESTDKADNGDNAAKDQKDSGSLKDGKWPASIYSKYGIAKSEQKFIESVIKPME